jgi:hypothetical protein
MTDSASGGLVWRKASRCTDATCAEVAVDGDQHLLRNSTDPDGPVMRFDPHQWAHLAEGFRDGAFTTRGPVCPAGYAATGTGGPSWVTYTQEATSS